jgi:fumarate reductase subunit D
MYKKEKEIKHLGITAIVLSVLVIIPSIILLLNMLTGANRQAQYGYSMYTFMLSMIGAIPTLLSIIIGIIAYCKYHKNKQSFQNLKELASYALALPVVSAVLIILSLLLDTFVFH